MDEDRETDQVGKDNKTASWAAWAAWAVCGVPLAPALLQTAYIFNEALTKP